MANITSNIFGLGDLYELQMKGVWPQKNRESYREFGYSVGGTKTAAPFTLVTSTQRIDYSNDTTLPVFKGNLGTARMRCAAVGNASFGWFAGLYNTSNSTVERLSYSNDTMNFVSRGNLSISSYAQSNAETENYGWVYGGYNPATGYITNISRIQFSNDSVTAQTRGNLTAAKGYGANAGNQNFGYIVGGATPARLSTVERIDFANDLGTASARSNITLARGVFYGHGNQNFGWFGGGSAPGEVSTFERLDYSNDTVSPLVRSALDRSLINVQMIGNSNQLYAISGENYAGSSIVSTISRINFYNDTNGFALRSSQIESASDGQATSPYGYGGASNSYLAYPYYTTAPYGYFSGGATPAPAIASTVDRLDFSNDSSIASLRTFLTTTRYGNRSAGNENYGYTAGGWEGFPSPTSTLSSIDRIDYSNDTSITKSKGSLSIARYHTGSQGNANFGYFGGGRIVPGTRYSTIDRIEYANDTAGAPSKSLFTQNRDGAGTTSTNNFGWFAGGVGYTASVDRLVYASDTTTCVTRGPLTSARAYLAGCGNDNYGWFSGGYLPGSLSTIERLEYSNDTATALRRSSLNLAKYYLSATGNQNYGYVAHGTTPGPIISTVDRIDYSNDTLTPLIKGPLSSIRYSTAGSSSQGFGGSPNVTNANPIPTYINFELNREEFDSTELPLNRVLDSYGYFVSGAQDPGASTKIERIDFSNDTTIASQRSSTIFAQFGGCGNGNNDYGWIAGGRSFSIDSSVYRMSYANDTSGFTRRADMVSSTKNYSAGIGNNNFGYWCGGTNAAPSSLSNSSIERINYSNDLINSTVRGSLTATRGYMFESGMNNSIYGYIAGGYVSPSANTSSIDRFDFSNDSANCLVRSNVDTAFYGSAGTGNENFGYIGGGAPLTSTIRRLDYSNDTTNASARGTLSFARLAFGAANTSNYGWFGGGYVPGALPRGRSTIDRLDFASDTVTASVRGPLTEAKFYSSSLSNASKA